MDNKCGPLPGTSTLQNGGIRSHHPNGAIFRPTFGLPLIGIFISKRGK